MPRKCAILRSVTCGSLSSLLRIKLSHWLSRGRTDQWRCDWIDSFFQQKSLEPKSKMSLSLQHHLENEYGSGGKFQLVSSHRRGKAWWPNTVRPALKCLFWQWRLPKSFQPGQDFKPITYHTSSISFASHVSDVITERPNPAEKASSPGYDETVPIFKQLAFDRIIISRSVSSHRFPDIYLGELEMGIFRFPMAW